MADSASFHHFFYQMLCQRIDELDLAACSGDPELMQAHAQRRQLSQAFETLLASLPDPAARATLRRYADLLWQINAQEARQAYLQGWRDASELLRLPPPDVYTPSDR